MEGIGLPGQAWFNKIIKEYHDVALTVANRVMMFFKYDMHAHSIHALTRLDIETSFMELVGADGLNLAPPASRPIVVIVIGEASLGEEDFTVDDDSRIQQALEKELSIPNYQEFMSDAQTSILMQNVPRAVLEIAIASEIAVKQAFFAKTTPAGAAFEYIEDKERIHIKVIELIDGAVRRAFGESFKDIAPNEYQDIDFLFRSRNKVAHRGEAFYRDDRGAEHKVTPDTLKQWWTSAMRLMNWLSGHKS